MIFFFSPTHGQDTPEGLARQQELPMLHPATPALHRAQLFTFAQGTEYKKAMLPWGGLDGTQIPVVKNKTLRKEGSWGCVWTRGGVALAELESSTRKIPVCSTLWFCTSLMSGTGGRRRGWEMCSVDHCVQGSRNKTDVWCRPRRRVLPWTHDEALQAQPQGSPGCSLGRWNSFWVEPMFYKHRSLCLYSTVVLIRHQDFQHKVLYMISFFWVYFAQKFLHPHSPQKQPEKKEERIQNTNIASCSCSYEKIN